MEAKNIIATVALTAGIAFVGLLVKKRHDKKQS